MLYNPLAQVIPAFLALLCVEVKNSSGSFASGHFCLVYFLQMSPVHQFGCCEAFEEVPVCRSKLHILGFPQVQVHSCDCGAQRNPPPPPPTFYWWQKDFLLKRVGPVTQSPEQGLSISIPVLCSDKRLVLDKSAKYHFFWWYPITLIISYCSWQHSFSQHFRNMAYVTHYLV